MAGTVRALPLGPRLTALRVFGTHPDAPGMADLVRSGRLLKGASTAEGCARRRMPWRKAPEPRHGRIWWWLHDHGLAQTRREKAELLRRAMGVESGGVYYRNGVRLYIEQMPDDEIIALDQETRSSPPAPLPPGVADATDSSWGWRDSPPYEQALKESGQPGTHETLNGRVPTEEEAKRMIAEIEDGHAPGGAIPAAECLDQWVVGWHPGLWHSASFQD